MLTTEWMSKVPRGRTLASSTAIFAVVGGWMGGGRPGQDEVSREHWETHPSWKSVLTANPVLVSALKLLTYCRYPGE